MLRGYQSLQGGQDRDSDRREGDQSDISQTQRAQSAFVPFSYDSLADKEYIRPQAQPVVVGPAILLIRALVQIVEKAGVQALRAAQYAHKLRTAADNATKVEEFASLERKAITAETRAYSAQQEVNFLATMRDRIVRGDFPNVKPETILAEADSTLANILDLVKQNETAASILNSMK